MEKNEKDSKRLVIHMNNQRKKNLEKAKTIAKTKLGISTTSGLLDRLLEILINQPEKFQLFDTSNSNDEKLFLAFEKGLGEKQDNTDNELRNITERLKKIESLIESIPEVKKQLQKKGKSLINFDKEDV